MQLKKSHKTKEIIIFSGGLGNQLFQYAFYLAKKKASPDLRINTYSIEREGLHNGFELKKLFGLSIPEYRPAVIRLVRKLWIFRKKKYFKTGSSVLLRLIQLTGIEIVEEKGYSVFNPDYLNLRKGFVLYFGFWQSPKYFENIQHEIREIFSFNPFNLSGKSERLFAEIQSKNSVSVHIRRGDFVSKPIDNIICNPQYYRQAMEEIKSKIENPYFVFFSDEPEWVKENFAVSNAVYVDWNQGKDAWQDMYLMSQCKHNIIANSTFSWWGAWLNTNKDKTVIAPAVFLKGVKTPDIYPENWIAI